MDASELFRKEVEDMDEDQRRRVVMEIIAMLSEGNPGALNVLMMVLKLPHARAIKAWQKILELKLRGPDIWVGYKDVAGGDLDKFCELLERDSPTLMNHIKNERVGAGQPIPATFIEDLKEL